MLVDDDAAMCAGLFGTLVGGFAADKLQTGIYRVRHFGSSKWPPGYEQYPEVSRSLGPHGVCDSVEQILKHYPCVELDTSRRFVIAITQVSRSEQPPDGGWRWHKWGEYIGDYTPQHEYLYDETIDGVLIYHIYEWIK